jgi:hypothetical protein
MSISKPKYKLIDRTTDHISVIQIVGFCLTLLGILYLLFKLALITFYGDSAKENDTKINGEEISICFFIIMLGISLAYPSLMKDQTGGISTMRVVVFMVTNVICILFLKIGWSLDSLSEMGLDSYWVGIIAFVFGAKASQTYFESKLAVPPPREKVLTQAEIAKLAIKQNQGSLKQRFSNIASISDAVHDLKGTSTHVVVIYLKDDNSTGLPDKLEVKLPSGKTETIPTEIIKDLGEAKIYGGESIAISASTSKDYKGSICCMVSSTTDKNFRGIVTAGHIYTAGNSINYHGVLNTIEQTDTLINDEIKGKWFFQVMNNIQDLAIVRLNSGVSIDNFKSFSSGYYIIGDEDVRTGVQNVTIKTSKKEVGAYLIDYNVSLDITYKDKVESMDNIILIGSSNNRNESKTLSEGGDSGSCVYETKTGKLIGLLLGGNLKYSFVLPIKDTLDYNNLKLV